MTAILFIVIIWLSTVPMQGDLDAAEDRPMTPLENRFASAPGFDEAQTS